MDRECRERARISAMHFFAMRTGQPLMKAGPSCLRRSLRHVGLEQLGVRTRTDTNGQQRRELSTSRGWVEMRDEQLSAEPAAPHDPRSTIHDPRSTIHDPRSTHNQNAAPAARYT